MSEFYRTVKTAGSSIAKDVEPEKAIRLYCRYRQSWTLQIRGPQLVGGLRLHEGRAFMIATAHLERADLVALRNAIDDQLSQDSERESKKWLKDTKGQRR